ncbi:MAG: ABC transporter substrate-binding protein [Gammaproteobacteria bacterium]
MTRRDVYLSPGDPLRLGVLMDLPPRFGDVGVRVYELVRDEYVAAGRFERGVELMVKVCDGPPAGPIRNTTDGYHWLCDQGCLGIVGPNHSDSNIALTPHVEQRRVPLMALGASAQMLSPHVFSIAWGSIPDDAHLCASWMVQHGYRRCTVTWDKAHHSAEYVRHFRNAAKRAGIRILSDERFSQLLGDKLGEHMQETIREHRALKPDAIVHFGTGDTASHWARRVNEAGWDVPRIMNGAFFGVYFPEYIAGFEGWCGTTMWDDDNQVLADFRRRYAQRYGDSPPAEMLGHYRDAMVALLEGATLAPLLTPDGLRQGLEDVRMVAAACGGPRTIIGFGPGDHRGHKGADIMVVRRVKNGQVVMDARYQAF